MRSLQKMGKRIANGIKKFFKSPKSILIKFVYALSPLLKDKFYLRLLFRLRVGYKLNLDNPQTYNEKLQWLKLYYRLPILNTLVDKYEVKKYVMKVIGEKYVAKNFGIWESFDEIDFDQLPAKFVMKTTHDSGGVVICKNKDEFDIQKARKKINKHLQENAFYRMRSWPYKNIKPRIIAEELLVDESNEELKDYKFFCFNGEPKALYIATERQSGDVKFDFYDIAFRPLDLVQFHKRSGKRFSKPKNYDLMIQLARELSKGLPHVRIDFYNVNGEIILGEFTFFHHGGLVPFHPLKWDYEFGKLLELPRKRMIE